MQSENHLKQPRRFQQVVSQQLVQKAQAGDMSAHSEIYEMFSQAIYALALGICRSQQCAEDVLHNTFVQLINKVATFENRAPFGLWLRQIAVNESLMYLRKQKKHKTVVSIDESPQFIENQQNLANLSSYEKNDDFTQQHSDRAQLSHLLDDLPEHVRMIVWLKEIEGYTHDEIAALVGKSPGYSKSLVSRTYQSLRKKMTHRQLNESLRG